MDANSYLINSPIDLNFVSIKKRTNGKKYDSLIAAQKRYYAKNRDSIIQKSREKSKERIFCSSCDKYLTIRGIKYHQTTKSHIKLAERI